MRSITLSVALIRTSNHHTVTKFLKTKLGHIMRIVHSRHHPWFHTLVNFIGIKQSQIQFGIYGPECGIFFHILIMILALAAHQIVHTLWINHKGISIRQFASKLDECLLDNLLTNCSQSICRMFNLWARLLVDQTIHKLVKSQKRLTKNVELTITLNVIS